MKGADDRPLLVLDRGRSRVGMLFPTRAGCGRAVRGRRPPRLALSPHATGDEGPELEKRPHGQGSGHLLEVTRQRS